MTTVIRILVLTGLSVMAATAITTAIWPTVAVVVAATLWAQLAGLAATALAVAVRYARARLALRKIAPEVVPAAAPPVVPATPRPAPADDLAESA